jgi:exosortase/archaeosortase family protein
MIKSILHRIQEGYASFPPPVRTFALRALALFIIWKGLYLFLWQEPRTLDGPLTKIVGRQSARMLSVMRPSDTFRVRDRINKTYLEGVPVYTPQTVIYRDGKKLVGIADPCNGLELFILYIGFILAMPASIGRKLLFGIGGLLVIHVVNLLRCSGLGLVIISMDQYFDFAHHYLFKIFIYATIFGLWVLFSKKLNLVKESPDAV